MSLTTIDSVHTVPATVDRLVAALGRRGVTVFARIDHAAGARKAGLSLADEEVRVGRRRPNDGCVPPTDGTG